MFVTLARYGVRHIRPGAQGCSVYTTATDGLPMSADAYARFFNPTVGIAEDPAPGSAAGPLADFLAAGRTGTFTVVQGRMGRPRSLQVTVREGGTTLNGRCAQRHGTPQDVAAFWCLACLCRVRDFTTGVTNAVVGASHE